MSAWLGGTFPCLVRSPDQLLAIVFNFVVAPPGFLDAYECGLAGVSHIPDFLTVSVRLDNKHGMQVLACTKQPDGQSGEVDAERRVGVSVC